MKTIYLCYKSALPVRSFFSAIPLDNIYSYIALRITGRKMAQYARSGSRLVLIIIANLKHSNYKYLPKGALFVG